MKASPIVVVKSNDTDWKLELLKLLVDTWGLYLIYIFALDPLSIL